MTVSSTTSKASYTGNGTTTVFAVPFYFLAAADLRVILRTGTTEVVQSLTTNYTVTGAGNENGGSVTMLVAPPSGTTLTILRNAPATQETDLLPNDRLPAESLEDALDKLTMLVQQVDEVADRALQFPASDPAASPTIPAASARASKFLSFDANGLPTATVGVDASLDIFTQAGAGAVPRSVNSKLREIVSITDFGAVLDGSADCSPAFNAAIAALPGSGGTVVIPDGVGCRLATSVVTGTSKAVRFKFGKIRVICPPGEHGIVLQSNGSGLVGAGEWATVFELTAPASPMVLPTITTTIDGGGVVTGASIAGGSGMRSCPVAVVGLSPAQATSQSPDAGLVLTQSGGTVSLASVEAGGTGYLSAPSVSILGGGHAAVVIDNTQDCIVSGFSVDFKSVPGTVGVYHRGGWWCDIRNVNLFYNVSNGVSSESATSIGLVVDSYTAGVPGPNGAFGGVYVSSYSDLHFTRRALIGHDTATVTTLQFNRCDFKNSFIHACVDVVEIGPVAQGPTGYFYDLINVASLTLIGGDFEDAATWFHFIGSCTNISVINTLAYSASGPRFRGQPGTGSQFQFAKTNSLSEPLRFGSGGAAAQSFQNTGWNIKGRHGFDYSGDVFILGAINLKLLSATSGDLDDTSNGGLAVFANTSGQIFIRTATAGANPRTLTDYMELSTAGIRLRQLPSSSVTAGQYGLWYDAGDSNRVKFVP
jgi:hypothetical protein